MNSDENNKSIQDKFDSRKFEVNQTAWNKLIPELDKLEKKKKRRMILYFLVPGILIPFAFILYLKDKGNTQVSDHLMPTKGSHEKKQTVRATEDTNIVQAGKKQKEDQNYKEPVFSTIDNASLEPKEKSGEKVPSKTAPQKTDSRNTFKKSGDLEVNIQKVTSKNNSGVAKGTGDDTTSNTTLNENREKAQTITRPQSILQSTSDSLKTEMSVVEIKKTDSIKPLTDSGPASLNVRDSILPVLKDSLVHKKDSLNKKEPDLEIFAAAYLVFTPGYRDVTNFNDAFNPSAGIGIRKFFNSNFGIGTGLYYTIYSNISTDPKLFRSSTQDFGYVNSFTEIKQKRLHYIKLPLTFELRLNKNTFSIGAEFMCLITGASEVRTYEEKFGNITETGSKKEYGYINGFSPYDIGAMVMYSRRLGKRISIFGSINTGFIDVKNNAYFNSTAFDRNKSLQLGVIYKLK
jgi:hypothetical protein